MIYIIQFLLFFSFSQDEGCIFLEGLELPCFGGAVACGSCDTQYSDEERQNACVGELPLNNPSGCSQGTCGQACCETCDSEKGKYLPCQDVRVCGAIDENCVGTKEPLTCDSPECQARADIRCGSFTCGSGCAQITCQGDVAKDTCYSWPSTTTSSGVCGCGIVGGTPGQCNGTEVKDAAECGGATNPCTGSSSSTCLGQSTRCWTCSYDPGTPGTETPQCNTGTASCFEGPPTEVQLCPIYNPHIGQFRRCPGDGNTQSPDNPPGTTCGEVTVECSSDAGCSCN